MIAITDVSQNSPEWFDLKRGVPSASKFNEIVQMSGKPSKQATKYLYRLAGSLIAGVDEEGYTSPSMLKGTALESTARAFYAMQTKEDVQVVGVCYSDDKKKWLCSPDALVGTEGGLEIKCPKMVTHVSYMLNGGLLSDYFQQVQGSLFVTGRKWWDLMSFCVGLPDVTIRVERDEKFIKSLECELIKFCDELNKIVAQIK